MNPEIQDLMTIGELKEKLKDFPDDTKVFFGCYSLQFYRLKWRGSNVVQIEFNQSVHDDEKGNVYVDNPSRGSIPE